MKIFHVVGARPNFVKMAPVYKALEKRGISQLIVHTGQHYDKNMSDVFFTELEIKTPDINFNVGSASHAIQTAKIMIAFEELVEKNRPDLVLVYGDVNSTVAAAMVCSKLGIKIGHVEAGLRSFDRTMPEEINRIITDQISDLYFIPSIEARENLLKEGIAANKIYFVGNVMIDTLVKYLDLIKQQNLPYGLEQGTYGVITLHRPSNVDDKDNLIRIMNFLNDLSLQIKLIFSIHPRTRALINKITETKLNEKNIIVIDPIGYKEFLNLVFRSKFVLTDSGGIQEETTYLGISCLTMRENTERPVTVSTGTNTLVGNDFSAILKNIENILNGTQIKGGVPEKWDGKTAERIADVLLNYAL